MHSHLQAQVTELQDKMKDLQDRTKWMEEETGRLMQEFAKDIAMVMEMIKKLRQGLTESLQKEEITGGNVDSAVPLVINGITTAERQELEALRKEKANLVKEKEARAMENKLLVQVNATLAKENEARVSKNKLLTSVNATLVKDNVAQARQYKSLAKTNASLVEEHKALVKENVSVVKATEALTQQNQVLEWNWRDMEDRALCTHEQWLVAHDHLSKELSSLNEENEWLVEVVLKQTADLEGMERSSFQPGNVTGQVAGGRVEADLRDELNALRRRCEELEQHVCPSVDVSNLIDWDGFGGGEMDLDEAWLDEEVGI
jgi:hypothetical protein